MADQCGEMCVYAVLLLAVWGVSSAAPPTRTATPVTVSGSSPTSTRGLPSTPTATQPLPSPTTTQYPSPTVTQRQPTTTATLTTPNTRTATLRDTTSTPTAPPPTPTSTWLPPTATSTPFPPTPTPTRRDTATATPRIPTPSATLPPIPTPTVPLPPTPSPTIPPPPTATVIPTPPTPVGSRFIVTLVMLMDISSFREATLRSAIVTALQLPSSVTMLIAVREGSVLADVTFYAPLAADADGAALMLRRDANDPNSQLRLLMPEITAGLLPNETLPPTPLPTARTSDSDDEGLGGGAIAGIVILVIVVLLLLALAALWFRQHMRRKKGLEDDGLIPCIQRKKRRQAAAPGINNVVPKSTQDIGAKEHWSHIAHLLSAKHGSVEAAVKAMGGTNGKIEREAVQKSLDEVGAGAKAPLLIAAASSGDGMVDAALLKTVLTSSPGGVGGAQPPVPTQSVQSAIAKKVSQTSAQPASDATLATLPFAEGMAVLAFFQGQWYPATVLEKVQPSKVVPQGGYLVSWHEDSTRTLIRPDEIRVLGSSEAPQAQQPAPAAAADVPQAAPSPTPGAPGYAEGGGVTQHYRVGDVVNVFWHGDWYPATICNIDGPDLYSVDWGDNTGSNAIPACDITPLDPNAGVEMSPMASQPEYEQ